MKHSWTQRRRIVWLLGFIRSFNVWSHQLERVSDALLTSVHELWREADRKQIIHLMVLFGTFSLTWTDLVAWRVQRNIGGMTTEHLWASFEDHFWYCSSNTRNWQKTYCWKADLEDLLPTSLEPNQNEISSKETQKGFFNTKRDRDSILKRIFFSREKSIILPRIWKAKMVSFISDHHFLAESNIEYY